MRPSFETHSRPEAPFRIGSVPWRSEEAIRLLVKWMRAVMPLTCGAVAA